MGTPAGWLRGGEPERMVEARRSRRDRAALLAARFTPSYWNIILIPRDGAGIAMGE